MKNKIQKEITEKIKNNNGHGIVAAATGVGKSKITIDYLKNEKFKSVLWVVPTEKLRDVTVPEEFIKWKAKKYFDNHVKTVCYASLNKLEDNHYDIVILDEGHKITELNSQFFDNNVYDRVLVLTATVPEENDKLTIFNRLNLKVIDKVSIEEAQNLGLVAPFSVIVVKTTLDCVNKNVEINTKKTSFKTTEQSNYKYLNSQINSYLFSGKSVPMYMYLKRMRFIYGLESKLETAKKLLKSIPDDKRVLIFCSNIQQAESLCKFTYHSKTNDEYYKLFNEGSINRLAVVNALNEGHNMKEVDIAVITQVNSKARNYIQRQGRAIRWRKNHTASIYIISCVDTVDNEWVTKSLSEISQERIKYTVL